jgi:hypothetical protein
MMLQTLMLPLAAYVALLPTVPGVPNPNVNQDNIDKTICVSGWTATVRPPVSYTDKLKHDLMISQHLSGTEADYELDHKLSIEDGGDPSSPDNLWMQPYAGRFGARVKDRIETKLKHLVCNHTITLDEARQALMTDWVQAYEKYIGPIPE